MVLSRWMKLLLRAGTAATLVFIYFPLSGIDARYKSRFGLVK